MDKEQRERRKRVKERWNRFCSHGGQLTYLHWLEQEAEYLDSLSTRLMKANHEKDKRFQAFSDYIADMETGMRAVEQAAETIGVKTTIPALVKGNQKEAVRAAIIWLYRMLEDAKKRFREGVSVDQAEAL